MADYRIDDLARTVGTTVRNIRAYQDRGLLHPPKLLGRAGIYSDSHVRRLRRILSLLQRGYASAQIHELLDAWDNGRDLGQVIDLEGAVTDPWSDEVPVEMLRTELARRVGGDEHVDRLAAIGWVEHEGDVSTFRSARLLSVFERVVALGWPQADLIDLYESMDASLSGVADRLVETASRHLISEHGDTWVPSGSEAPEAASMFGELRHSTLVTVREMLAKSMEESMKRALDEHLARVAAAGRT